MVNTPVVQMQRSVPVSPVVVVQQQPTMPDQEVLPPNWHRVFSADGRRYYQNDVTHQTSWEKPVESPALSPVNSQPVPTTTMPSNTVLAPAAQSESVIVFPTQSPSVASIASNSDVPATKPVGLKQDASDDDDEYQEAHVRHWYDREHILWLFAFVFSIYDYVTDIQVSLLWLRYSKADELCPELGCSVTGDLTAEAYVLLPCSTLGFLAQTARLLYDGWRLWIFYRYPMNRQDEEKKKLHSGRRKLWIGWIPLILEDILSLVLVWTVSISSMQYVEGAQFVTFISMSMSAGSVILALCLSWRTRMRLKKSNAHQQNKEYSSVLWCHCAWCFSSGCCVSILVPLIIYQISGYQDTPMVMLENPQAQEEVQRCDVYGYGNEVQSYLFTEAPLVSVPGEVDSGCDGQDYAYALWCDENDGSEKFLSCELSWKYRGTGSLSTCSAGLCDFNIEVDTCGYQDIVCNNFNFTDGHPTMFQCLSYCSTTVGF